MGTAIDQPPGQLSDPLPFSATPWKPDDPARITRARTIEHGLRAPAFLALCLGALALVSVPAHSAQGDDHSAYTTQRYAVIIGVGLHTDRRIPTVRFAQADAIAVRDTLGKRGYKNENILLLTDNSAHTPTLRTMMFAIGQWLHLRARPQDIVLIYFAGQGATEVDGSDPHVALAKYLLTRDTDPSSLYGSAFPLHDIETVFRRLKAHRVLFVFDACFTRSGALRVPLAAPGSDDYIGRIRRMTNRVVIGAASDGEYCLELTDKKHGLLTYHLLKGLDGDADVDRDGVVSVSELFAHLNTNVVAEAATRKGTQTPFMIGVAPDFPLATR